MKVHYSYIYIYKEKGTTTLKIVILEILISTIQNWFGIASTEVIIILFKHFDRTNSNLNIIIVNFSTLNA